MKIVIKKVYTPEFSPRGPVLDSFRLHRTQLLLFPYPVSFPPLQGFTKEYPSNKSLLQKSLFYILLLAITPKNTLECKLRSSGKRKMNVFILIDRTMPKKKKDRGETSWTGKEVYPNYHKMKEICVLLK